MKRRGINWADTLTGAVNRAVDTLFVLNPRGTSIGVMFGVIIHGALQLFRPVLEHYQHVIDISQLQLAHFLAGGAFLFNVPNIFHRRDLPPQVEDALATLRIAEKEGKLTVVQLKLQYLALCAQVVSQVQVRNARPSPTSRKGPRERRRTGARAV